MTDRRRGGLVGWVRRKLYFRGALLILGVLYGVLAFTLPRSPVAPLPELWHALFGAACVSTLAVVASPNIAWLRRTSGATAVMAPVARAIVLLAVPSTLSTAATVAMAAAWLLAAFLAFIAWPTVLPPHIDTTRLADRMDDGEWGS